MKHFFFKNIILFRTTNFKLHHFITSKKSNFLSVNHVTSIVLMHNLIPQTQNPTNLCGNYEVPKYKPTRNRTLFIENLKQSSSPQIRLSTPSVELVCITYYCIVQHHNISHWLREICIGELVTRWKENRNGAKLLNSFQTK